MENKKGWSWMGFLFAPHYYAGYGQLKKGLVLAVISGIMPLVAIAVAIYGGLKARQELPIKEVEFNWKNALFTLLTVIIVSVISQVIIAEMEEKNVDTGIESSEKSVSGGFFSSGGAMPLTQENVDDYMNRVNEATQNVDQSAEALEKMYEAFKKPLEDMGYDFEETLLNTRKATYHKDTGGAIDAISSMGVMVNNIMQGVYQDKEAAVSSGFISQEAIVKLELYDNLYQVSDFDSLFNILDMVIECENMGGGICNGQDMIGLLHKNIAIDQGTSASDDELLFSRAVIADNFVSSISAYGKYSTGLLKRTNGDQFQFGQMNENSQFQLDHTLYEELKKDSQLVWWL